MQHNEKLANAIEVLWGNNPGVEHIIIDIEMPLNSGLQLVATGVFGATARGIRVRNARAFYVALKDYAPNGPWNRMHIEVSSASIFDMRAEFDKDLRDETIEQVK